MSCMPGLRPHSCQFVSCRDAIFAGPFVLGSHDWFSFADFESPDRGVLGPSICQPCYRCPSLWLGRNSLLLGRLVAHSPAALSRGAMPEMFIAHLRSLGSLARARVALMAA